MHQITGRPLASPPSVRNRRAAIGAIAAIGAVIVLGVSLADRMPRVTEQAAELSGIDGYVRGGVLGLSPWSMAHAALWAGVTILACLIVSKRSAVAATALLVFGFSVALELLQEAASHSRSFQVSDIAANFVGGVIGAAVAWVLLGLWAQHRTLGT